ncbi:MAG TPA: POTRA domain-containing protein [Cytophagales bacterium]|nr:POTRA domain-containing protein [Cytophagales bacterium]
MKKIFLVLILSIFYFQLSAQIKLGNKYPRNSDIIIDYSTPQEYEIGGITVVGAEGLDPNAIISITGLSVGDMINIPGEAISSAIKKLWDQSILADVEINATKVEGRKIFLEIKLKERPRLANFRFEGINKAEKESLTDKIKLIKGRIVSDALIKNTQLQVKKFFIDKGFLNVEVDINQLIDSSSTNYATLKIKVDKKKKVKINRIYFDNNEAIADATLKRKMKKTKEKIRFTIPHDILNTIKNAESIRLTPALQTLNKIFMPKYAMKYLNEHVRVNFLTASKFNKNDYADDKEKVIDFYNSKGYRDAIILNDTIYKFNNKSINIEILVDEGKKYYFRDINWKGNYVYDSATLSTVLGVKKGDIYNKEELEKRLRYNPTGDDISSLYMDNGYLFFNIEPVEVMVEGDSIDLEMRISEGNQATINKVYVTGNTKTNDHVVLREIRTLPGQKFNRSLIIRTQREISQLGYFDPEKINPVPIPNMRDGTVDIEYQVVEKPSDQIELSGGWSGYGFIGTLGVVFNNFSARKIFNPKEWRGVLPSGDGQRLALRLQASGKFYQTYSLTFTEPWLGGKKPNSFTIGLTHSVSRIGGYNDRNYAYYSGIPDITGKIEISSASVSLGRRLKFPDDFFTLSNGLSYTRYGLDNYSYSQFGFVTGAAHNINFNTTISRSSIDNPMFPRGGSSVSLSVSLTPPYSLWFPQVVKSIPNDFTKTNDVENGVLKEERMVEYHKWMFDASQFISLTKNLVINVRAHFGFLGYYNKNYYTRFERFELGGDGLAMNNFLLGTEIIGLRGYENRSLNPYDKNSSPIQNQPGVAYNKFVFETRYLISPNPSATIWVHAFAEGGNNFSSFRDYNPFKLYRTAGVGARIFMPAFGLLGIDYGYGFDEVPGAPKANERRFMFTIGQQFR